MVKGASPALYLPSPLLTLPDWRSAALAGRSLFEAVRSDRHRVRAFHPTFRESCFCPMANIKSQIKRNRQNEVRAARNKAAKSELKTRIKAVIECRRHGRGSRRSLPRGPEADRHGRHQGPAASQYRRPPQVAGWPRSWSARRSVGRFTRAPEAEASDARRLTTDSG